MGFQLNAGETLEDGLRRIAIELADDAEAELVAAQDATPDDFDKHIHNVRKTCKKMRGLLRLARKSLGKKTYNRENVFYRDLARRLAGARESHVLLSLLEKLLAEPENELNADHYQALIGHLQSNYDTQAAHMREDSALLEESVAALQTARERISKWKLSRKPRKLLRAGLLRIYRRGNDEMMDAYDKPTAENLHEWRKSVKYLWYHLQILTPLWPESVGAYVDALDDLGDALGLDHDYAELKELLYQLPDLFEETDHMMTLVYVLEAYRGQLQADAWNLGARVYAEAPDAFVDRHVAYWRVWQHQQ